MNVFNYINEKKKQLKQYQDKREQHKAIKTANKLSELKKERIKLEARDKIYKIQEKENAKLQKARSNLRKRTPAYRIVNAVKDNIKKNKKNKRKMGQLPGENWNF